MFFEDEIKEGKEKYAPFINTKLTSSFKKVSKYLAYFLTILIIISIVSNTNLTYIISILKPFTINTLLNLLFLITFITLLSNNKYINKLTKPLFFFTTLSVFVFFLAYLGFIDLPFDMLVYNGILYGVLFKFIIFTFVTYTLIYDKFHIVSQILLLYLIILGFFSFFYYLSPDTYSLLMATHYLIFYLLFPIIYIFYTSDEGIIKHLYLNTTGSKLARRILSSSSLFLILLCFILMIIYHYDLMDGVTSELLISISSIVFLIIMTLTYNTEMNYTIFEKEKLNQESNEKEVLFEDIIHSTVEGVMLLDKNFNIIYINKIFSNLLNHEGNIIGKKFFEEYPESPIKEEIYNCRETLNHEFYETSFYLQNKNVILNGWIIPFIEKDKFNGIIITGLDITQDEERQSALKNSIDERNNLLTEVHHRVKNNMQIIISLLNLQSHKIKDQEVKDALFQTQARVRSMALVHENLYKNFDFKDMNIKEYINDLVSEIKGTYITSNNITFETDVVKAFISIDIAVSLGLILNELLTNCIKYAFPDGREGTVWIKLTTNDDLFKLTVEDNGIGVDNSESTGTGIGSTLINSLVTQIEGTYKIESENGTKVTITFKN